MNAILNPAAPTADRATGDELLRQLTRVVAEVTRYPEEILEPHADFEHDLGIDSVKRGEILVAVRKQFGLPEGVSATPEQLRSLSAAAAWLRETSPSSAQLAGATTSSAAAHVKDLAGELLTLVAEVTRYPREILTLDADLEHDLGIDSVKRGEILLAVRKALSLDDRFSLPPEQFRTIAQAAAALAAAEVSAPPAVARAQPPAAPDRPSARIGATAPAPAAKPRPAHEREVTEIFAANGNRPFLGKIALVTGSGRGIGREIASSLARLGATVIVNAFHSRNEGEQTAADIRAAGGDAYFLWGSVANERHRQELFNEIEARFGGLDFFVSNASNGLIGEFEEIGEAHWEKGYQTNVVGFQQCALLAARLMHARGGGKIISLSTPVSMRHVPGFACMAALKASVESLTRTMAVEFEKYRVSVNCISAGAVYGELIHKFPGSDDAIRYWEEKSLGKRLVYTQEICNLANFLLSGAADSINGSVLVIDGGITIRL